MTRRCYHADDSYYDPAYDMYLVVEFTEHKPHYRVVGRWVELLEAIRAAEYGNSSLGLSDADILHIRLSSERATRAARTDARRIYEAPMTTEGR